MDTSDPEIEFDADGACSHCTNYSNRVATELVPPDDREARLQAIVGEIKRAGKGKEYDCVLGVSGGVDSTMVAYIARQLGLRSLAVHFDNGWNSEVAVDNIKRCLTSLDIDLYTYVVDWEEFRDLQLSFLKASVPNCEIPTDHGISAVLWNTAHKQGIRYILNGSNLVTEGILPVSWTYTSYDLLHLKAIHKRFGGRRLRTFPTLSLARFGYYVAVEKVRTLNLLNYVDYNKAKAMDVLQSELGWRYYGGKHYESIYTRFYQGYYLPCKFGFDKRRAHLSTIVVSGEMSREAALREMEQDGYPPNLFNDDLAFVLKKLGITRQQFDKIMAAPVKTHMDYPNMATLHLRMKGLQKGFKRLAMRT
jgi:N-acetyl sugar amidotransferase